MKISLYLVLLAVLSIPGIGQELEVGDMAPEIKLNSPDGKELSLSDLHGKMVLIDFWASWCAPCRKENPYIVKVYNKYKDENFEAGNGFTVFSVSLDFVDKSWKVAIEKDQLEWPWHVWAKDGWSSKAAKAYYINKIPTNFLIDGEGKIVAIDVRAPDLDSKLRRLRTNKLF